MPLLSMRPWMVLALLLVVPAPDSAAAGGPDARRLARNDPANRMLLPIRTASAKRFPAPTGTIASPPQRTAETDDAPAIGISRAGLDARFRAPATGGVPVIAQTWDFGDGRRSTDAAPRHHYAAPGRYRIAWTATLADGRRVERAAKLAVGARRAHNDIDGDGRSDLLWCQETCESSFNPTAVFAYWTMNGAMRTGSASFWYDTTFKTGMSGDFDGDGRTDLLWSRFDYDANLNQYYIWRSRSDGGFDSWYLAGVRDGWIAGVGDLNGDGKDDVVVRTGLIGYYMRYWLIDGANILRVGDTYAVGDNSQYTITGIADLDGDARSDILWTHPDSGNLYLWRSRSDGAFQMSEYIGTGNALSSPWSIVALQDMDADGKADLVWEGRGPNYPYPPPRLAYWLMDGATVRSTRVFDPPAGTSRLGTVADLDGDGRHDIVWRNTNPANTAYPFVQLWRSRADGGFDELFIGHYAPWSTWSNLR